MATAVYPGSFDPVTYGHLDVIRRASSSFEHVIVGVLNNSAKSPLFSATERVKMLKGVTEDLPNVEIESFQGLSVSFARKHGAAVILRGRVRSQISSMNCRWHRRTGCCVRKWIPCL